MVGAVVLSLASSEVVHTPLNCPCGSDHSRVGDREFIDGEGRLRFPGYALCEKCGAWTNRFGPGGHDDESHPVSEELSE
jgi:hypothetical protein